MPGHMGAAGQSSYGLAAPGWPHGYPFFGGPGLSLERSVGMAGFISNFSSGFLTSCATSSAPSFPLPS